MMLCWSHILQGYTKVGRCLGGLGWILYPNQGYDLSWKIVNEKFEYENIKIKKKNVKRNLLNI
jgi:hypothetical protein